MARISPATLSATFDRAMSAARDAGLDTTDVVLVTGSITYGRAWRIVRRHPVTGGHYSWGHVEHIGSTPAEADRTLLAMTRAWWMVAQRSDALRADFTGEPWPGQDVTQPHSYHSTSGYGSACKTCGNLPTAQGGALHPGVPALV